MRRIVFMSVLCLLTSVALSDQPLLDLTPITTTPEPVTEVDPAMRRLMTQKVRGIWIPGDLYRMYPGLDVTVGQVLKDADFNLVVVYMSVDRKNRSTSSDMETRLPKNVQVARQLDLPMMIKWFYGSAHEQPYRRYRDGVGHEHDRSCCPLDASYIDRHVGRWAVRAAKGGAHGMSIDTEMYESDATGYPGPCFCDDCFANYLRHYSTDWMAHYRAVPRERRGSWVADNRAITHYSQHAARRIERQYDAIRAQCQAVNPSFFFAYAPLLEHIPGMTRGLGTSRVPCIVFSEGEYTSGPRPQTWANVQHIRETGMPALYVSGHMILYHEPAAFAKHAKFASLYADGWWAWFGGALTTCPGTDDPTAFKPPYGRAAGTTAKQYLDLLTQTHKELDTLLASPKGIWPRRDDPRVTPTVRVPRRKSTITIDGRLDDAAWKHAAVVDITRTRHDEPVTVRTTFQICWDNEALYVSATCDLAQGKALRVPQRGRDNALIWEFDGVEIFIAPRQSTRRYAQFMVSALGDVCDLLVDHDAGLGVHGTPAWSADVQTAAHAVNGRYILEIRIPFANLAPSPAKGDRWNANFYRFVPDIAAWSPTFGGFHSPLRFGTLVFE